MTESVAEKVERLREEGKIDADVEREILRFDRFLKMVGNAPTNEEGKKVVGKEWFPYIEGTGPPPDE